MGVLGLASLDGGFNERHSAPSSLQFPSVKGKQTLEVVFPGCVRLRRACQGATLPQVTVIYFPLLFYSFIHFLLLIHSSTSGKKNYLDEMTYADSSKQTCKKKHRKKKKLIGTDHINANHENECKGNNSRVIISEGMIEE